MIGEMTGEQICKICGGGNMEIFEHTAHCRNCRVLLYYPYPKSDYQLVSEGEGKKWPVKEMLEWYSEAAFLNHTNFTDMLRFTTDDSHRNRKLDVLDYGGGGGQFALVCKSHFPEANVYITDIADEALLDVWRPMNLQIPFAQFESDTQKFDLIFLNDVFEHVSNPGRVLEQLSGKLKTGGRLFIDTPKQFWIYPVTKLVSTKLYTKVLRGTVSQIHLQIWSRRAFDLVVKKSGLKILRYVERSEYTMPASYYLRNMSITNPFIKALGSLFYRNAKRLAHNKIMCVLTKG
jgi:2-polyprenyl-3-methyl-5-hydroxy-6-metoxy-1,4-benzoquinol methylase